MGSKGKAKTPGLFDLHEEPEIEQPQRRAGCFVRVALNRPVRTEFTYELEERLREGVAPGSRVAVPLGSTRQVGVVVGLESETDLPKSKLRRVLDVFDPEPIVGEELLGLTRWMADRYACSWGEAMAAVLPAPLKRERGTRKILMIAPAPGVGEAQLAELEERFPKQHRLLRELISTGAPVEMRDFLRRLNLSDSPARTLERRSWVKIEAVRARPDPIVGGVSDSNRTRPETLGAEQELAVRQINALVESGKPETVLLWGVTGSGKTEVYLRVIERALELGRAAIILVPEIALTPQTVGWFRSRFGDVAVMHSRMTDAQRLDMWLRMQKGELRVVVGARSAIFAPVANLGVIVVDEEHEPSFKQGNVPRYHARDVAIERARRAGAVCILGSATPALETWHAASTGAYRRMVLSQRVGGGTLPSVDVIDMRGERERGQGPPMFSRILKNLLAEVVESKEQAILFLNRRGFVPVLYCPGCKGTVRCAQCDVSLTYHREIRRLVCHGCCNEMPAPRACPVCTRPGLRQLGVGSERVQRELERLLPEARVGRMDSDTMRRREDYEETLESFGRREIDVLVGTQMIAKGLDFPGVTLVGIVDADQGLHMPDFRSEERTFQLIAQVAGRAGRGALPGRIVIQTRLPEEPTIRLAARTDYIAFAKRQLEERESVGFPPFGRYIRIVVDDESEERVEKAIGDCASGLRKLLGPNTEIVFLGPITAPVGRLRGRYRHNLALKIPAGAADHALAVDWLADFAARLPRPRVAVDVDAVSVL